MSTSSIRRRRITVHGLVQGVGFRPFVFRLAQSCGLSGFVRNDGSGVSIEVQGVPAQITAFERRLPAEVPSLARIVELEQSDCGIEDASGFSIQSSDRSAAPVTLISPDTGVCSDCLNELFDPTDRRYLYPFINCTNCGPRYTIVEQIPYDRPYTSMREFKMCPDCREEYDDPYDRRFHAQPNACPVCGPRLSLLNKDGKPIETDDPVAETVRQLRDGRIIAIRGLGGFHLAVDARNEAAVATLRKRKGRAQKPFALMASGIESVEQLCHVSDEERRLLVQQLRPIVLLEAKPDHGLAPNVASDNRYLGFMLPYTPLHHLLMDNSFDALVMTSGNFTEEPIAIGNLEAEKRLGALADAYLVHDREILQRCDDSIVRMAGGAPRIIRRARGYVPTPVFVPKPTRKQILAVGGELKNTIALSRGNQVFLSQHIGDLDNPEAYLFFEDSIRHLQEILEIEPEAIAFDLHPEYLSSKWARNQNGLATVGIQHHHAHLASVMAENGVSEPTIGIILDGTGYGTNGSIWGGEVLVGDFSTFDRFAWLDPLPLPGGEKAIQQPWRIALAAAYREYGRSCLDMSIPGLQHVSRAEAEVVFRMIDREINTPLSSGCGRLFDAVAGLTGICTEINYEAQAAILLEMAADDRIERKWELPDLKNANGTLPSGCLVRSTIRDLEKGVPRGQIARCFHEALADLFAMVADAARSMYDVPRVGLSGGAFQNTLLLEGLIHRLEQAGFDVLTHTEVPANDGGLSLGQVVIANAQLEN